VKPVALMRWLIRLGCPPGGLVLDPFAGSGSTGIAALAERRPFLGIERERAYAEIARARLSHHADEAQPGRAA
jgi:site-specific DNA-methyltransferase (adenine-specific)